MKSVEGREIFHSDHGIQLLASGKIQFSQILSTLSQPQLDRWRKINAALSLTVVQASLPIRSSAKSFSSNSRSVASAESR